MTGKSHQSALFGENDNYINVDEYQDEIIPVSQVHLSQIPATQVDQESERPNGDAHVTFDDTPQVIPKAPEQSSSGEDDPMSRPNRPSTAGAKALSDGTTGRVKKHKKRNGK